MERARRVQLVRLKVMQTLRGLTPYSAMFKEAKVVKLIMEY